MQGSTSPQHAHMFNRQVSRYQKGKTNLDFTEARDSESQWHQLDHMQVCTSLQTDNHASNPPLSFLQAGCPYCRPTNSVKALKAGVHSKQNSSNSNNSLIYYTHRQGNFKVEALVVARGTEMIVIVVVTFCDVNFVASKATFGSEKSTT